MLKYNKIVCLAKDSALLGVLCETIQKGVPKVAASASADPETTA
jgi:hypothetical protein